MAQEIIKLKPDQFVVEIEVSGDPAGDLDVGRGLTAHRDEMGSDAEAQHRCEDDP
jgi:hypothetical protein